ncbi:MAG: peptidoglycan bridge formation glycyltransferase FemA/FemB family protein [Desulfosalsimonadaceae bacterium]|jgi:lipid II:glycine glycyltransferase (peptidoglycan interpeptide bridge formation enzyme)|nr:MAG: peptidoglycan bridge formation glycyltransferase FemA/FemB family protein [Desulfobacteraceae bacterium]
MRLKVKSKNINQLFPTGILFQTEYWARVKSRLGWVPYAYDIEGNFNKNDVLVLIKPISRDIAAAYIPQGPEVAPEEENYGSYLEALSDSIIDQIGSDIAFIRYDLPWLSPYAGILKEHPERDFPDERVWEMRMNFGTQRWNLKKAPLDMTATDIYTIDITGSEDDILERMRSKTRYNIKFAMRKGVHVSRASLDELPVFYELYLETAARNGFFITDYKYFSALFDSQRNGGDFSEIMLMMATHDQDILAGAIMTITGNKTFFLHGASSNLKRNHMGSYALHWQAIRYARSRQCLTYDMGAVSPAAFPDHPFFGLYRFKTGFGGQIVHKAGTWDYPIKDEAYRSFRNWEKLQGGYENGQRTPSRCFC